MVIKIKEDWSIIVIIELKLLYGLDLFLEIDPLIFTNLKPPQYVWYYIAVSIL